MTPKRFTTKVEGYGALWAYLKEERRFGRNSYFDITPNGPACLVLDWDEKDSTITLALPDTCRVVAGSMVRPTRP